MTEIIAYFQNQIRLNKTYIEREYNREKHVDYPYISQMQDENAKFAKWIAELETPRVDSSGKLIGVQDHGCLGVNRG